MLSWKHQAPTHKKVSAFCRSFLGALLGHLGRACCTGLEFLMAPVGMTLNLRALHAQLYTGRPLHQARQACNLPNMLHRLTVNCGGAGRGAWREGRLAGALWEAALSPAGQQRPGPWSGMRWPGCGGLHTYLVYRKCGRAA